MANRPPCCVARPQPLAVAVILARRARQSVLDSVLARASPAERWNCGTAPAGSARARGITG